VFAVATGQPTLKLSEPLTFGPQEDHADSARFLGAVDQCSLGFLDILFSVDISLFFSPDSRSVHSGDRLLLKAWRLGSIKVKMAES
jgi:hypothetical protein